MHLPFINIIFLGLILSVNMAIFCISFRKSIENNGGPRDNNFGMVNNLENLNNSKVIDNDNNNNNNINLSNLVLNRTNISIYIINNNYNID